MGRALEKLLAPQYVSGRKSFTLSVPIDQLELLDKLTLFLEQQSGQSVSRSQVVEEALEDFLADSVEAIQQQYDVDLRGIPSASLERGTCTRTANLAKLDTLIVPAKDNIDFRRAFFRELTWPNVRTKESKLRYAKYIAVYVGAPTSGITHYAQINTYLPDDQNPGRFVVKLRHTPLALQHMVLADDAATAAGMRSCRYTSLELLTQAESIRDLFPAL